MAKRFLSIKNYEEYQHYKHRNPPWVKLHLSILDDPDFLDLPDASKWHYIGLILLASRHGNDIKPDEKYIKNRLGLTEKLDLTKRFLKDHVLASNASKALLTNSNHADSEKSRDRVETEKSREDMSRATRDFKADAVQVLRFLNEKARKNYREVDSNLLLIAARLKGTSKDTEVDVQTCKSIIAKKVRDWGNDPKMHEYLRPETLFGKTKFESYLGELNLCAAQNVTKPSSVTPLPAPVVGGHLRSL